LDAAADAVFRSRGDAMNAGALPSLVNVDWLEQRLHEPGVRVVDASWHLPTSGRHAGEEFLAAHIPGAVFLDIDRVADTGSDLPHMLPEPEQFAEAVGRLGIDNDTDVIVYDTLGLFSAARAWWMFRAFGHDRVAVLDGGLPAWRERELPLEAGPAHPEPARFEAVAPGSAVWTMADIRRNLDSAEAVVLDARPPGRFAGEDPEPRPGVASGHIPGSRNVPFGAVLDAHSGCVLPVERLRELFRPVDDRPIVCSCGTGVSACVLAFALHRLGRDDVAVYDGSWTEWAGDSRNPVETGPDAARQHG
jgi:thiosulfate/3-mercaptopyruvate sulfurtransferase